MVPEGEAKMNLAFYVNKISDEHLELFNMLNDAAAKYPSASLSVFYDDLDFVSIPTNFAMFNSTELWSFTGTLICFKDEHTIKALNVINKFKLIHMYKKDLNQSLFNTISLANNDQINMITRSEEDNKELYRTTGKKSKQIQNLSIEEILEVI